MEKTTKTDHVSKFNECVYCKKFFSCTDKKYKSDSCLKFQAEKEDIMERERSKMDQD